MPVQPLSDQQTNGANVVRGLTTPSPDGQGDSSKILSNGRLPSTSIKPKSQVYNIIAFGETGVGKSSLIKMLCHSAQQLSESIVSGEADGFTKDTAGYSITIDDADSVFMIWDTPGLLEGGEGTVQTVEALQKIHHLVEDLNHKNETVNLLVYCIRASRFRNILRINYDLVAKLICEEKVPVVAVINGLENEDNMERWWKRNHKQLEKDMKFQNHVCVTTTEGKFNGKQCVFRKEYEESKKKVKEVIVGTRKLAEPWKVTDFDSFNEKREKYMEEYNSRTETERNLVIRFVNMLKRIGK